MSENLANDVPLLGPKAQFESLGFMPFMAIYSHSSFDLVMLAAVVIPCGIKAECIVFIDML